MEKAHLTDYLFGVDLKIPDWFIRITYMVNAESVGL